MFLRIKFNFKDVPRLFRRRVPIHATSARRDAAGRYMFANIQNIRLTPARILIFRQEDLSVFRKGTNARRTAA